MNSWTARAAIGLLAWLLCAVHVPAWAAAAAAAAAPGPIGRPPASEATDGAARAGLGIVLNGENTGLIAVASVDGQRIAMLAEDLRQLRIVVDPKAPDDALVDLEAVAGLSYVYDEPGQLLLLTIDNNLRDVVDVAVAPRAAVDLSLIRPITAFLLNYDLYSASAGGSGNKGYLSSALEARLMSPLGIFVSTGVANTSPQFIGGKNFVRLDSYWRYVDPATVRSYAAGDVITGALGWTGSYRLGGLQLQSAFRQRSDLITGALPQFSGTAALPSTVDMFINNIKTFSGQVPAGRFTLNQLPVLAGGDVRIVTTDALGRETVINANYYYTPDLLRQGVIDYSAEVGALRQAYGTESFRYGDLAATATGRYGLSDDITLEGHGEYASGFSNLGIGIVQRLGGFGSVSISGAQSRMDDMSGRLMSGRLNLLVGGVSMYGGMQRYSGHYFDLGRVSTVRYLESTSNAAASSVVVQQYLANQLTAQGIDQAGISFQPPFDRKLSISLGYTGVRALTGDTRTVTLSMSRSLTPTMSVFGTGYHDLDRGTNTFYVGLTKSFDRAVATASVQRSGDTLSYGVQASGLGGQRQGAFNWGLMDQESSGGLANRLASLSYRAPQAYLSGALQQTGGHSRATLQAQGALLVAGGELLPVNRIGDAFALVKNAGPGAEVRQNSVILATSDQNGSALLPDVQSLTPMTIGIDPTYMPLGWQVPATEKRVVAAYHNGVVIDFEARKVRSAVVRVVDATGKDIPAGHVLRLTNGKEAVIGYDGQAYLEDIEPLSSATVDLGLSGVCRLTIRYEAAEDEVQPLLGPLACVVPQ